jgi:hypothetical protein
MSPAYYLLPPFCLAAGLVVGFWVGWRLFLRKVVRMERERRRVIADLDLARLETSAVKQRILRLLDRYNHTDGVRAS